MAAVLSGFAVLLLAIGAVSVSATGTTAGPVFAAVAFVAAALLAMITWGLIHSTRPQRVGPAQFCTCDHDHDPAEQGISDTCGTDDCAHDCASCVLAASRSGVATS